MTVQPKLLTLILVCLQDGLALSFPALNCTKVPTTGGNMTTRASKSTISDVLMDRRNVEFQTTANTATDSEGLYTLTRNASRFESRAGPLMRTQYIFSAGPQHRNDDVHHSSVKESHATSDLRRRPVFYLPSSRKQLDESPYTPHTLQAKRSNSSHQFADRNTFNRQPGIDERKHETGLHQIAPRIYPYRLGPQKIKSNLDMHSQAYEISGGTSSNIHEIAKAKQPPNEMKPSGKLTQDYMETEPNHDKGVYKPHDYHYDHFYDSYEYEHHTTTPPPPSPSPPPPPPPPKAVVGHYRVGFKLFYIPLYAGMIFVAYVLVLIIRSIIKHKGQVPYNFLTNPPARMLSDDVAERVIRALEKSRKRYNTRHK